MPTFTDPVLAKLHTQVVSQLGELKPITPLPEELYFRKLAESIISQQLAGKAAAKIRERVHLVVGKEFTPATILAIDFNQLRQAGLSNSKTNYVKNVALAWQTNQVVPAQLSTMDDEAIIANLITIKGVGRWTAEMFLIFGLGRHDIFSIGDYGLKKAMIKAYKLPEDSGPVVFQNLAKQWSPQRSLASRVLWKSLELA